MLSGYQSPAPKETPEKKSQSGFNLGLTAQNPKFHVVTEATSPKLLDVQSSEEVQEPAGQLPLFIPWPSGHADLIPIHQEG